MADRPIIMSAPMVRALLAGLKTQTRRLLRPQPLARFKPDHFKRVGTCTRTGRMAWEAHSLRGPIGAVFPGPPGLLEAHAYTAAVGDRLWVRERAHIDHSDVNYAVDMPEGMDVSGLGFGPSIFMPRWASRLTLTVTDVRVQRLHEITEDDAISEGALTFDLPTAGPAEESGRPPLGASPRQRFEALWDSLHGAGAWNANLWVAAVTFTARVENIDAAAAMAETAHA